MRSNDDLYQDLLEQALTLIHTYEPGEGQRRTAKLREVIHLMDAYDAGQDITLAKLAYDPETSFQPNPIRRLRYHLGDAMSQSVKQAIDLGNGYFICAEDWGHYEAQAEPFVVGEHGPEIVRL